jgi:transcriptional regulator with XRE-family HTH domain
MPKPTKIRRLAIVRRELGLTQADLGKAIGVTQARISQFESDGDIPKRLLLLLAQELKYDSDPQELTHIA